MYRRTANYNMMGVSSINRWIDQSIITYRPIPMHLSAGQVSTNVSTNISTATCKNTTWSTGKLSVRHRWSIREQQLYQMIGVSFDRSDAQPIYQPITNWASTNTRLSINWYLVGHVDGFKFYCRILGWVLSILNPICSNSKCDNSTFHINVCNLTLLFSSPIYATRYLCFI